MKRSSISAFVFVTSVAILANAPATIRAQNAPQVKDGAAVIVDGVVREVFRSPRRSHVDYVVQIEVTRSEIGPGAAEARGLRFPAPGEAVYVHVFQTSREGQASGALRRDSYGPIPAERTVVRAYLYPRAQGGWQGAYPDWFDQTSNVASPRNPKDPEPVADADADAPVAPAPPPVTTPSGNNALQILGVKAEPVEVNGRLVLKVTALIPDSPAQKAGIEKGDVIIGANRQGFTSLQQLADVLAKSGDSAELAVLNVRDNQQASVKVDLGGVAITRPHVEQPLPTPTSARTLGVTVEPKRLGLRTALQVTQVHPGSPAQKAGIEVGDVLIEAAGITLTDAEKLQNAVDKSEASVTVKVRDSRSGKDVDVDVPLDTLAPAPGQSPRPSNTPSPPSGSATASKLGITTKAGTADLLPVVKVTAVTAGSPAEKAGIEVGDAIVGINDKVVFAPDLFDEALKTAGSSFTLVVLDVKTGKKTPVKVNLDR